MAAARKARAASSDSGEEGDSATAGGAEGTPPPFYAWRDPAFLSDETRLAMQAEAEAIVAAASEAVRAAASRPIYAYRGRLISVYALSNSMPDHVFVPLVLPKSRAVAANVPGNASSYAFFDEESYLDDYRGALFGVTRKKLGWDAGRHLEIMASGCLPIFLDIGDLPSQTLALYPRKWLHAAVRLPGVRIHRSVAIDAAANPSAAKPANADGRSSDPRWYLSPEAVHVDASIFNATAYARLAARVLAHARRHLSSSGMASHVLRLMGLPDASAAAPLLFVTHCSSDFTGDSLLYGLKVLLGAENVVDVAYDTDETQPHPWCREEARTQRRKAYLYDTSIDYAHNVDSRRGVPSRFCIGGRHPDSQSIERDQGIERRIEAREFGAVIYGSAARTTALLPLVSRFYARDRVGFVYGEDLPLPIGSGLPMEGVQRPSGAPATVPSMAEASRWGVIFARELFDAPADLPWKSQTMMVPGVADRIERGWHEPLTFALEQTRLEAEEGRLSNP